MLAFNPISYGPVQFRVANIIIGVVPIFGIPSVLGIALGVFIGNTISPLGPIDLISAAFSLAGLLIVWYLRNRSVMLGLTLYSGILGTWISTALFFVFGLPIVVTIGWLIVGIWLATGLCGYALYKALKRYVPQSYRMEEKK